MKKELRVKINNVITAQDLFSQAQEKYQLINSSLPDRPNFFEAANQTQKTSQDSGIAINKLTINLSENKETVSNPNLNTYSIGLVIDGQFSSVTKIISDLLSNRRLINIDSFIISRQKDSPASPSASTNGGIKTSFSASFNYWPETYGKK